MILSPQQQMVIDCVKTEKDSINLVSYAGTGKTSTLMEVAKNINREQAFLGAFNKSIADEFKERLGKQGSHHVKGGTIHSAGFGAWAKMNPRLGAPDGRKVQGIIKNKIVQASWDKKLVSSLGSAVGYGKQACLGVEGQPEYTDTQVWQGIIDHYNVQDEMPPGVSVEAFIEYCKIIYKESLDLCDRHVDFDDLLLAPLYYKAPFRKYAWVMLDEAQDTNTARRLIMYSMMGPGSRLLAVGDVFQAIYGFAGADSDAMDIIKRDLGSKELYLSVTYRCPKAVVAVANQWVPDLEAHATAPQGLVTNIKVEEFWKHGLNWNDVILCRNTRPLVGVAGRLRDNGVACIVEGMSTKGLVGLAEKWGEDIALDRFMECLSEYRSKEIAKWTKKENMEKVEWVEDRCGTLKDMCRRLGGQKTVKDLVRRIDFLFGDTGANVLRLCTIHRSKGREWNRVYLIGRNRYQPSPYAKAEWEHRQEDNLAYVAVTRAKVELVEVEVPWKKKRGDLEWWEEGWGAQYDDEEPF